MKTAKRRLTAPAGIGSAVPLTEFSDLDPDTLHLVRRAANGFPALLAKSLAGEIRKAESEVKLPQDVQDQIDAQRRYRRRVRNRPVSDGVVRTNEVDDAANAAQPPQENPMPSNKKFKKALLKQLAAQGQRPAVIKTVHNEDVFVKSAENAIVRRIRELDGQMTKSGGAQGAPGLAFLLNRAYEQLGCIDRIAKGTPSMDDFKAVEDYLGGDATDHPARIEAQRSAAATARAVTRAQGNGIDHMGWFFGQGRRPVGPREAVQGMLDDSGRPETLETFEIQTHRLEKQLAEARTPSERESLGYQVTRRKLLAGHYRGEI